MRKSNSKIYNVFKQNRQGRELLESVKAENLAEARKQMVVKYMTIALSTQNQLVIEQA